MPNLALIQEIKASHPSIDILYVGEKNAMEEHLMARERVPFKGILCGKLRRYFSLRNILDFFKIPIGFIQSFFILLRFKPKKIFCTGGYVSFPVALAGRICRIPVILHESDVTPGLANKMCAPFASTICISFEESRHFFSSKKRVLLTGIPIRSNFSLASREKGIEFSGVSTKKPVLFIMGGSLGASFINSLIWRNLPWLLKQFEVIHICGKEKKIAFEALLFKSSSDEQKILKDHQNCYHGFEFVGEELKDLYALSDVIVARAGAISLAEIGFFKKPVLLIPLPAHASRNDQEENAAAFAKNNVCRILKQTELQDESFLKNLQELAEYKAVHHTSEKNGAGYAVSTLVRLLVSE